ncbi:hypothetical protein HYDPIDRAFT_29098 [Hydnomerulius pinastri MD-312]|uniref:DUF6534 domain-containing protein n=1 Tax=Hydnomerulius pinastri MD-312 TaxID=994086 RepID=A0A0C9VE11_9AGAM|nr:hypothetical protein HYDPIDRAFT_29098 [Hydnomerulius pinastri MD-312]
MVDEGTLVYSLGMVFFGYTLATWLFGVNTLQAYTYFQNYNDGLLMKLTVIAIFTLDVANTALNCWGIYLFIIPGFGEYPELNIPLVLETTVMDVSIFIVHCFFAQSVWHVSRHNRWLTSLIVMSATVALGNGLGETLVYSMTELGSLNYFAALSGLTVNALRSSMGIPSITTPLVTLGLGFVTFTDLTITIALVYYLHQGKSSIGPTSTLLDKLMLYSVRRGVLTTVTQVLVLALWFSLPSESTWALFQLSLGKIYTLTFIAILNRRDSLKRGTPPTSTPSAFMPNFQMSAFAQSLSGYDEEDSADMRIEDRGRTDHVKDDQLQLATV